MMPSELPVHLGAVREAILGGLPDEPMVSSRQLAGLRHELKERLSAIAGIQSSGEELHVDRYVLPSALRCPASSERDSFEWTAPFAARSLGLPTLSRMARCAHPDVMEALEATIAEAIAEEKSLGLWLSGLDAPARAATVAVASSWASRAWVAVPWREIGKVRFHSGPIWHRPLGFGSSVILRGRPDGLVLVRSSWAQGRVVLTIGWPDSVVTRLDSLVVSLDSRPVPLRAVTVHPGSGTIDAVDVNHALLKQAVDDVVAAIEGLSPTPDASPLAELPGPHCRYCHRLADCRTGSGWAATQAPRIAGIPVHS